MSPLLAHRYRSGMSAPRRLLGAKRTIAERAKIDAVDPEATWAGHFCCDVQLQSSPCDDVGEGSDRLSPHADLSALVRAVAEAQVDLLRIRRVRHELIAAGLTGERVPAQLGTRLAAIERYERCALARRRRAIRALDAERRVRPHAEEVS